MSYEPMRPVIKVFEEAWQEEKFKVFQEDIEFFKRKEESILKSFDHDPDAFGLERIRFQIIALASSFEKFKEAILNNVERNNSL